MNPPDDALDAERFEPCPECDGTGMVGGLVCSDCDGTGEIEVEDNE